MPTLFDELVDKGSLKRGDYPQFLYLHVCYETIMGSYAYGVSTDDSDKDIYAVGIPPKDYIFPHLAGYVPGFGKKAPPSFENYQKHHIAHKDNSIDYNCYSIVQYFHLLLDCNPNMIDSIFTPQHCILYCNSIGTLIRENRKLFLHKGAWHRFKGYAFQSMHKMRTKNPTGKRKELVEKYGFDCYLDSATDFLTNEGWKKFDEVDSSKHLLATVEPNTGNLVWSKPLARIDKKYTGKLYTIKSKLSNFSITRNHNVLVSPANRGSTTKYVEEKSDWQLVPLSKILDGEFKKRITRTVFFIRKCLNQQLQDYPLVSDEYLTLAGLFLSEGSLNFYLNGKVKHATLTQTPNGKPEQFNDLIKFLSTEFPNSHYEYKKPYAKQCKKEGLITEGIWKFSGKIGERLYQDFGHGSRKKKLPQWCFKLSVRQIEILWKAMIVGDGYHRSHGDCLYTSSTQLSSDIQAMLTIAGLTSTVQGPYENETTFNKDSFIYHIVRPDKQDPVGCVFFKRLRNNKKYQPKDKSNNIIEENVRNKRVVCFETTTGTLVTRCNGKVALQGNCKYAYHIVRLLNEVEQILMEGDLDLHRNNDQLKAIRRGDWTEKQIEEYFEMKEKDLETLYIKSELPKFPDEDKIKKVLLDCLEIAYDDVRKIVDTSEQTALLNDLKDLMKKYA